MKFRLRAPLGTTIHSLVLDRLEIPLVADLYTGEQTALAAIGRRDIPGPRELVIQARTRNGLFVERSLVLSRTTKCDWPRSKE